MRRPCVGTSSDGDGGNAVDALDGIEKKAFGLPRDRRGLGDADEGHARHADVEVHIPDACANGASDSSPITSVRAHVDSKRRPVPQSEKMFFKEEPEIDAGKIGDGLVKGNDEYRGFGRRKRELGPNAVCSAESACRRLYILRVNDCAGPLIGACGGREG